MSSEQPATEPDLAVITRDPIEPPSKRRATRKGKGKGPPDTSQEVDNGPSRKPAYRPLAKRPMPDTQETGQFSSCCSMGKSLGHQGTGSTGSSLVPCLWGSHLERITSLAVSISHISRIMRSAIIGVFCDVFSHVDELLLQSENLQQSYLGLKECVQPSLAAWHSHLEKINSLAVAVSQIPQLFTPATTQLLEVDMGMLWHQSESLQKSYFALKEMVQQ